MDLEIVVAALLSSPSASDQQDYHRRLLEEYALGLEVRYGTEQGKCLHAIQPFEKGKAVLRDPPLVALQHFNNMKHALVCQRCFKFIGSIGAQIASHVRPDLFPECPQARAALEASAIRESGQDQTGYESDEYSEMDVEFDDGLMQAVGLGVAKLPYADLFPLDAAVGCPGGCCEVAYCSDRCARLDYEDQHRLLCVGRPVEVPDSSGAGPSSFSGAGAGLSSSSAAGASSSSSAPVEQLASLSVNDISMFERSRDISALRAFYRHARSTNDTLVLAGKVIAQVLLRAEALLRSSPSLTAHQCLMRAWLPYQAAHKALWWDILAHRSLHWGEDSSSEEDQPGPSSSSAPADPQPKLSPAEQAKELATESVRLLRKALLGSIATSGLSDRQRELVSVCEALLDPRVLASVIGIFELNNLSFEIENPVEDYFLHIDDLPDKKEKKQVQKITAPLLDALGRRYCIYAEGTAFYPLQSCCNHSCEPSADAMRRETDRTVTASLYATRDILPGDEVSISYIELVDRTEDKRGRVKETPRSVDERRADLEDYMFECRCGRCVREETGQGS